MRIIQLTDTHLFARPDERLLGCATRETLAAVIAEVAPRRPDLIVLTGDQSQDGSPASYRALHDLLAPLQTPCYGIPGNHDEVEAMAPVLGTPPFHTERSVVRDGWHLVLLNSQIPGAVEGALDETELTNLRRLLEAHPALPTLLALHHPPFSVGSAWLEELGLQNARALFEVVDAFPQVKVVLCGHVHQDVHTERNGVHYYSTPSTCIQFALGSDQFALDPVMPGFREVELRPDGTFTTHVSRVPVSVAWDVEASGY